MPAVHIYYTDDDDVTTLMAAVVDEAAADRWYAHHVDPEYIVGTAWHIDYEAVEVSE